jgi:hypothetical protein
MTGVLGGGENGLRKDGFSRRDLINAVILHRKRIRRLSDKIVRITVLAVQIERIDRE